MGDPPRTERPLGGFYEMCQEYGRDAGREQATIDQEYARLCADVEPYGGSSGIWDGATKDRRP